MIDMSGRLHANLMIVQILKQYLEKYPDTRFGQALENLGLVKYNVDMDTGKSSWNSEYNTEPSELLKRLKNE